MMLKKDKVVLSKRGLKLNFFESLIQRHTAQYGTVSCLVYFLFVCFFLMFVYEVEKY